MLDVKPVELQGKYVRLVPLSRDYLPGLLEAVADGDLWRLWYTAVPAPAGMGDEIDRRLRLQAEGRMLPFVVLDAGGQVVGMTTYMNIDAGNHRLEIGSTWYRKSVQRSPVNTECKLLLLKHAFEQLGCIAVEFRTHWLNHASRHAIERLGARLDGVLRSHLVLPDGSVRDTCVYSILCQEWPAVQQHLAYQLTRPRD
ncbi:GNAT family N-acetyltransferase [Laribacter hongkongensis]|uniref:GNAT family N-acetyltransferase n=1 Tax=Laribacter hongkongensis TaxID=168471 RepID=UPI001EFC6A8D|nr:GNAT family protein [Laribacter hongkongensis]MCG9065731.1 GNAT family N-acetyltransferase [Laribacter hongkongensis]